MATAKWSTPGTVSSNLAGSTLNSLANGSTSAFVTYDNSGNLDLYADVLITLGSWTSTAGASITLRVYSTQGGTAPTDTGAVGGGETYTVPLNAATGTQTVIIPMIRLYPRSMRMQVTNNSGAALAASGHTLTVGPYGESIA